MPRPGPDLRPAATRFAHDFSRVPAHAPGTPIAMDRPGDALERQAERSAERGMAASEMLAADGAAPRVQRACATAPAAGMDRAPASVRQALAVPGRGLEPAVRRDMEQRFGHDFSRVRIHADAAAARSAREIAASAYTVGHDIVFGAGGYAPSTAHGRHLLAHELAHTVQQAGAAGGPRLQRKCNDDLGTPTPDCTPSQDGVSGWQFLFDVGCDDLLPGEEAKIKKLKVGSRLKIHGFASQDGPAAFNEALSCHRANRIAELAARVRADCPVIGIYKHGESPVSAPGVPRDVNPPSFWRSVIIQEVPRALESGERWLDPAGTINFAWGILRRAKADPTATNLMLVSAWREEVKDWLTGIGKKVAPQGTSIQLSAQDLDDYRRFYASAEQLWMESDNLLALHKHADAAKDTYTSWAVGTGSDQGDAYHVKKIPPAKYHVDIFGEGYFKGAINIGMAERTSTTGIHDSRVPNLIYRRFSGSDPVLNKLPIADHTADLVTSENGPIGMPGLADEIARIIAPGGTIILYNPASQEDAHDEVARAVGGTVTEVRSNDGVETLQTTIVAPPR
ncbi:MAG TPA: DUF4157 domain-containing protein [Longimicrobium sp.]|nr:DUF4157 domain-containing protein [Longimicrobium sp.]